MKAIRRFTVRPVLPEALAALDELAANLRWSWHQPTIDLFREVDEGMRDHASGPTPGLRPRTVPLALRDLVTRGPAGQRDRP